MSQEKKQAPSGIDILDNTAIKSEQFLEKHLKLILIGTGVVVLAVGGYFGYKKFIVEPKNEKASIALFKAEDKFLQRQDSLALKGEGLSTKGLDAIIKEYSGTDAANLAQAYKGIALYDAGKYQEAIDALKKYSGDDAYVAPSISRLIGDAYTQLKRYDEAAAIYERAAKQADNEAISPSCLIKAGHAYEKLGNKAKAKELYERVKNDYATSPEATAVEAELMRVSN